MANPETDLSLIKDLATENRRAVDLSSLSRMREKGILDDYVVEPGSVNICMDGVWHHLNDASVGRLTTHIALWSRVESETKMPIAA